MEEIPFPTTVWMYNNLVNNGISTTNLNWLAGFLNHQPEVTDRENQYERPKVTLGTLGF